MARKKTIARTRQSVRVGVFDLREGDDDDREGRGKEREETSVVFTRSVGASGRRRQARFLF